VTSWLTRGFALWVLLFLALAGPVEAGALLLSIVQIVLVPVVLGVATRHLSALAGALFSVWHNLTGPALASLWSRR
jgi:predicted Na+-dependent transporter